MCSTQILTPRCLTEDADLAVPHAAARAAALHAIAAALHAAAAATRAKRWGEIPASGIKLHYYYQADLPLRKSSRSLERSVRAWPNMLMQLKRGSYGGCAHEVVGPFLWPGRVLSR